MNPHLSHLCCLMFCWLLVRVERKKGRIDLIFVGALVGVSWELLNHCHWFFSFFRGMTMSVISIPSHIGSHLSKLWGASHTCSQWWSHASHWIHINSKVTNATAVEVQSCKNTLKMCSLWYIIYIIWFLPQRNIHKTDSIFKSFRILALSNLFW